MKTLQYKYRVWNVETNVAPVIKVKVKVKFTLEQAMKAQRGVEV